MPEIQLLDGKKISFVKSISGFELTKKISKFIVENSKFLSVNAQLNAANLGYHTLTKYSLTDLLIINENELRHEMRDKESNLEQDSKKKSAVS